MQCHSTHVSNTCFHRCLSMTKKYQDENVTPTKYRKDPVGGLFTLPLYSPTDWSRVTHSAISTSNSLRCTLDSTLHSPLVHSLASETLRLLDAISNTICSVIDAAEMCRSVHYDPEWRISASDAFHTLSEYISELNGDVSLHATLVRITENRDIMESLTDEERRMANMLQNEFERDGIHLPVEEREEVKRTNGHIVKLESLFMDNLMGVVKECKTVDRKLVEAVLPGHVSK